MSQEKAAKQQQEQEERESAIRQEAFDAGLTSGFEDGFVEGQCAGFEDGVSRGYTRCAANYKDRSFWARLRYLINPKNII